MTRALTPRPLTAAAFAAFGDVVEASDRAEQLDINYGHTVRFNDLAAIDVADEGGRAIVSLFRADPLTPPLLKVFERHPLGSQAFMPMGAVPFLIVVAQSDAQGKPGAAFAFLSDGRQGVNYARGVWHHPLLSLAAVSDFLVVDRAGPGENCDVAALPQRYLIESVVP